MSYGGFAFEPTFVPSGPNTDPFPGGIRFTPGPVNADPFGFVPLPENGIDPLGIATTLACKAGKSILCAHPISRPAYELACGPCDTPLDPNVDPLVPIPIPMQPFPRPQTPTNGASCAPCGPNECNIPYVVQTGPCAGQTRQRKGRFVRDPATGAGICIPKKRRMNPMNATANRRSMSRLKGAHREAKKIIDTLDKFAKPRRSRAAKKSC